MDNKKHPEITRIIKDREAEIKKIISSKDLDIVSKTVILRKLAREIVKMFIGTMEYKSLDDFFAAYDRNDVPLIKFEGEGVRYGDIIVLKDCPMSPLFEDFKEGSDFPEYWKSLPDQYMTTFKNEAILHPLCTIHQISRDELTAKIPKGKSFVHSRIVACRSMSSGKVVYSKFGIQLCGRTEEDIKKIIEGMACAFHVK